MKKYVKYALALAAAALLAFLMVLIGNGNGHDRALRTCEGLSVEFSEEHNFVTSDDIKAYLDEGYGAYIGQRVDSVDLHKVEALLDSRSAVLKSEAWITPDNIMHVKISQREPVVRFQTPTGGFYADEKGFLFPLQENFTGADSGRERPDTGKGRLQGTAGQAGGEAVALAGDRDGQLHGKIGHMGR